ncbi:MAG: polysaccharide biosynthesis tyrosine autokinase [Mycetocola sp.]
MSTDTALASPRRIIAGLLRRWYVIVLAALVGAAAAFGAASLATPIYHSTSTLYFALRSGSTGSDINQGSTYTQNQMLSFARLGTSSIVLGQVIENLDLPMTEADLRRALVISIPQNTVVLDVRVGSSGKELSADIANAVAKRLATVVRDVAPIDAQGNRTVEAKVIEPAVPALFQTTPDKRRDTLVGGLAGALIAAIALALTTILDTRVRSESALGDVTDRPLLGTLSLFPTKGDKRPIVVRAPNSAQAEEFRRIRSSLRFASASHDIRSVAVTSSIPGEGKSTVSTNLALTLAETGARVVIVDADLRRPSVADVLSVEPYVGLTNVLVDKISVEEVVHQWGRTTLDVLAAGEVPPNPAELLASTRMKDLIASLSRLYDFVIVDTAPVLSVADATVIAQQVDATIMVVDSRSVRRAQLMQSVAALERAGAHVAGVVLNRVPATQRQDPYVQDHSEERGEPSNRRTVAEPSHPEQPPQRSLRSRS